MRSFCFIIFFIGISLIQVSAQPLKASSLEDKLEVADERYAIGDFYNALELYEEAYKEVRDKELAMQIAELHVKLRDFKKAESWYKRVLRRDRNNAFVEYRFEYGKVLKAMGNYPEAIEQFTLFMDSTEDQERYAETVNELRGIQLSGTVEGNMGVEVKILDQTINSSFTESSPYRHPDGSLYFASFQRRKKIVLDGDELDYHCKIYMAKRKPDGSYDKPIALDQKINREGFHTGNVSFSKDGNRMYFTRAEIEGNEISSSRIYMSRLDEEGWSPALEVYGVSGDFISTHPTVGELYGNEVLFFSSDMNGGNGGMDIYYATYRGDNDYAAPVNLGPSINTIKNDITPFYNDGTLYFSSDGHPGLGGLDIFKTTWDGASWSEIENIGFQYNTTYDDFNLTLTADGSSGFLISNRPDANKKTLKSKTCCDDIYAVNIRPIVIDLLANVSDKKGPLNGAIVKLRDLSEVDGADPQIKSNTAGNTFNFLLDSDRSYKAIVTREGYYPDSIEFNTVGVLSDYTIKKNIVLKAMPQDTVEIVTINEPIRLNNIYYDLDDDKILPDAEIDLEILEGLLKQYSDMVIELSSHTDSQGVSTYNQRLSQRRAESAKRWLVERGIREERIQPVGYGETQILNRCVNGVRCTDDEHRFNRRTEFKIVAGPETIEIKRKVVKPANRN